MSEKIKLLIADDHDLIRQGLSMNISLTDDIEIIGEAKDGEEAVEMAKDLNPDILLLDINMPKLNGIEVLKELEDEDVKTIILTTYNENQYITTSIEQGCKGYLLKNSDTNVIIEAVRLVHSGEYYFGRDIINTFLNKEPEVQQPKKNDLVDSLTKREIEIISLITQGLNRNGIADKLHISPRTVDAHKYNIYFKLEIKTSTALVKFAIENNLQ